MYNEVPKFENEHPKESSIATLVWFVKDGIPFDLKGRQLQTIFEEKLWAEDLRNATTTTSAILSERIVAIVTKKTPRTHNETNLDKVRSAYRLGRLGQLIWGPASVGGLMRSIVGHLLMWLLRLLPCVHTLVHHRPRHVLPRPRKIAPLC